MSLVSFMSFVSLMSLVSLVSLVSAGVRFGCSAFCVRSLP